MLLLVNSLFSGPTILWTDSKIFLKTSKINISSCSAITSVLMAFNIFSNLGAKINILVTFCKIFNQMLWVTTATLILSWTSYFMEMSSILINSKFKILFLPSIKSWNKLIINHWETLIWIELFPIHFMSISKTFRLFLILPIFYRKWRSIWRICWQIVKKWKALEWTLFQQYMISGWSHSKTLWMKFGSTVQNLL